MPATLQAFSFHGTTGLNRTRPRTLPHNIWVPQYMHCTRIRPGAFGRTAPFSINSGASHTVPLAEELIGRVASGT